MILLEQKRDLRFPARHLSHLAQAGLVGKNFDRVAGHGFHVAHWSEKAAAAVLNHLRNAPYRGSHCRTSQAMASSAARPNDSISLGTSNRSAMESFS